MDIGEYRRLVGANVWHYNQACPDWPTRNFEVRRLAPPLAHCPKCNGSNSEVSER